MKKASKMLSASLLDFRFKPDWEQAQPLLEKAGLAYKQAGATDKAKDAYERASTAAEKNGSPWHAARNLEQCAELTKQSGDWAAVGSYFQQAAQLYVEAGKATTGADCLARGAKGLEDKDSDLANTLYENALDIYENEGKESVAADLYRQASASLVRSQKYAAAVSMLLRFGATCEKSGASQSLVKSYLGAIVIWLYAGDAKQAWQVYQEVLGVDMFATSDEAFAADALFEAYRSGNAELIRKVVASKTVFKFLDASIGRLAMKLPSTNLPAMARDLGGVMGTDKGEGDNSESAGFEGNAGGANNDDELL